MVTNKREISRTVHGLHINIRVSVDSTDAATDEAADSVFFALEVGIEELMSEAEQAATGGAFEEDEVVDEDDERTCNCGAYRRSTPDLPGRGPSRAIQYDWYHDGIYQGGA